MPSTISRPNDADYHFQEIPEKNNELNGLSHRRLTRAFSLSSRAIKSIVRNNQPDECNNEYGFGNPCTMDLKGTSNISKSNTARKFQFVNGNNGNKGNREIFPGEPVGV